MARSQIGKLIFLGTGGSAGVPMIGCHCPTCLSKDLKNQRLRSSALLEIGDKTILIDAGPDFRAQALRHDITKLDGVLLTHTHFDHVSGLDELRAFYVLHRHILPVLVSIQTLQTIKKRYDYLFVEKNGDVNLTAQLDFQLLKGEMGKTEFCGIPLHYVSYKQANVPVNGFRFGSLAYLTDIKEISDDVMQELEGIDILVMSALREEPSKVHLSFKEAVSFAQKLGAKQTYFTHIGHETEHHTIHKSLPERFAPAYDGLQIPFTL